MFWGPGIPEGSLKPEELGVRGAVGGVGGSPPSGGALLPPGGQKSWGLDQTKGRPDGVEGRDQATRSWGSVHRPLRFLPDPRHPLVLLFIWDKRLFSSPSGLQS